MRRLIIALATGFYCGYIPFAPGTLGSLLAVPALVPVARVAGCSAVWAAAVVAAAGAMAVWLANEAEIILGEHDSRKIVIDEVTGMLVAGFLLPISLRSVALCFLLFRFFDIAKPPPVGWIERNAPGGVGIVADDVAAGIYANLVARFFLQ